jgi:hypothetical protein
MVIPIFPIRIPLTPKSKKSCNPPLVEHHPLGPPVQVPAQAVEQFLGGAKVPEVSTRQYVIAGQRGRLGTY